MFRPRSDDGFDDGQLASAKSAATSAGTDKTFDPDFLFHATFSRTGDDLTLAGDGRTEVVLDYFADDGEFTALRATNGAMLSADLVRALTGPAALGQYAQASDAPAAQSAQQDIGHIAKLQGAVTIIRNGVSMIANVGDVVLRGDVVQTGNGAVAGLVFKDGSAFEIFSDARLVLTTYAYNGPGQGGSQLFDLVQGKFSFASGDIAADGDMRIGTAGGIAKIHGTAGGGEIASDNGQIKLYIYHQRDGRHEATIYDSAGSVIASLRSDGGRLVLTPNPSSVYSSVEIIKTLEDLAAESRALYDILKLKNGGDGDIVTGSNGIHGSSYVAQASDPGPDDLSAGPPPGAVPLTVYGPTAQPDPVPPTAINGYIPNYNPLGAADAYSMDEDGLMVVLPAGLLGNDRDPEGALLSLSLLTNPLHGTLALNSDGSFVYTPDADYHGIDTFQYLPHDGTLNGDPVTVTLTVNSVNDAPVLGLNPASTPIIAFEQIAIALFPALTLTDIDSRTMAKVTVTISGNYQAGEDVLAFADTASIHGVFDAATGALTLTAVPGTAPTVTDFEAALRAVSYVDTIDNPTQLERTISVVVQDPDGVARNGQDTAQAFTTLTVTPVNDIPTFVSADALAATEDRNASSQDIPATSGSLIVNDLDIGDHLTASVTGDAVATYSGGALPPGVNIAALVAAGAVTFTDATTTGRDLTLQWTYDPAAANLDWLPEGATLTLTYTAQLNDGSGDAGAQPLTVVITGSNDNPSGSFLSYTFDVEAADASAQALSVTGTWSVSDADIGDAFTQVIAGNADLFYSSGDLPAGIDLSALIDPATLSFVPTTSNGGAVDIAWNYNAAAVNIDWLAYGQALYISFAVTLGDGTAVSADPTYIYVIIEGTNDAPTITGATSLDVTEAFDIAPISGTLTVNDVDIGDAITGSVTGDATAVWSGGTLPPWVDIAPLLAESAVIFGATMSNGGDTNLAWIYNPQAANVEWLAAGATLTITYTAQVNDSFGNVGSQPLTIVITGTNDGPSAYFFTEALGTEADDASAQAISATGTWSVSDADIGDVLTPTIVAAEELYYTGSNFPAGLDLSALLDPSNVSFAPATSNGGTVNIAWSYNAAAVNLDWIAIGHSLQIAFLATVGDGTTESDQSFIIITIAGTNDAPTITGATSLNFTELANASAQDVAATSGTLTVHDLDIGDATTGSVTGDATAVWSGGTLPAGVDIAALVARNAITFGYAISNGGDANLSWTYNPAAANLNWLAEGATLTLTYTAQVDDGQGSIGSQPLTIVITGTNDGPSASSFTFTTATEAGDASEQALSASGTWSVSDADIGDVFTPVVAGVGDLFYTGGDLPAGIDLSALIASSAISFTPTFSNGGSASIAWSYNAAAVNLDWLASGQQLYISYAVTLGDGTASSSGPSSFYIIVEGTNDAPVIAGATNPASVIGGVIDQTLVTGSLTVKDADIGDSLSGSVIGSATINYSGGTLPNTANAAAFASASAISFTAATATGADQALTWKYTPAAGSFGWLRPGETVTLTYYARVNDGHGNVGNQPIVVTISGSNNAPSIVGGTSYLIVEAADASHQAVATTGGLTVRDVNYGDVLSATVSGPATATYSGTLPNGISLSGLTAASALSFDTAAANGGVLSLGWSYNAGSMNLDWMRAGTSITVTYNVVANDTVDSSNASTVTIVINGSNDAPTIAAISNPSAISESQAGITQLVGTLSVIDLDAGDTLSASVTGAATVSYSGGNLPAGVSAATLGAAAAITLGGGTSNGGSVALNWSYAATQGAFDWLGAGETVTLTYTARVNDGSGNTGSQPLVITIHGENDGPVLTSGAQTAAITEDFTYTVPTTSVVQNGGFETLSYVNSVYTYAGWTAAGFLYPPGAANGAHSGAHNVSFASAQNGSPGTWSQNINTVAGVTYTLEFWATPTLRAGSSLSVSWNGQTVLAYTDIPFAPGTNPSSPAEYVKYTVDVVGTGTSSPLVFSIYSPYYFFLDDVSLKAVITPGLETAKGIITFTDADRTDTHTISVAANNNIGNFTASLVNDSTGGATGKIDWSYNVTDAAVSYLAAQQTLNQTYKVLINDGHGGVTTQDVVVTVTGVNDAPVLNTQASVALNPQVRGNAAPVGAVGTLVSQLAGIGANITDADDGAVAGIAITMTATSGMTGTWYYSTNNGTTWTSFTASASSARLLLADGATRIYFQPSSSTATGTGTITFQAWDGTVGVSGSTGNAGVNGGTTAFSTASDTASVYVGTTSSSNTTLTSSTDTVFFASGSNTVNASLLSNSSTLTTFDSLTGGTGIDTLALAVGNNASGTQIFDFSAMNRFFGFDVVRLASNPNRSTSLTFGNANITSNGTLTVDGSAITLAARAFTVNASSVNNGGSFIFVAGASNATSFTGGSGNDTFRLTNAQFALTGHVLAGGGGTDTINITNAATIADSAFTGVSGVERLQLGNFSNAVTLGALASAAFAGRSLTIDDSAAAAAGSALTVNAAAFTADLVVMAGAGHDSLTGGSGDDVFQFTSANLTASDTIVGGGGSDTIQILDAANLADAAFAGVSGIETLLLGDFTNSVTLGGAAGGAVGNNNTLVIDASAAAAGQALTVNAAALSDSAHLSIFGGAGDDTFIFANTHFSSDEHISGGAGRDTIQIADAATVVDSDFANVTGVEVLKLGDFTNHVTLGASAAASGGGSLTVDGSAVGAGSSLKVDASAMGASSHVTIIGGAGNDVMIGSAGSDIFSGGAGSDTFVFTNPQHSLASAFDTVTDFVSGVDVFQIGHTLSNLAVNISGNGTGDLIADLARLLDASNLGGDGAAQVSLTGGGNAGTYLVIGDAFAGFDGAHDAVVRLANAPVLHATDFIV